MSFIDIEGDRRISKNRISRKDKTGDANITQLQVNIIFKSSYCIRLQI
jgi:hypothetical protein